MADNNEIGEKLKAHFASIGMTQQQVADELGVKQATVNQLLNGKSFGKNTAQKWHDAFGFRKAFLITGEGDMFADGVHQSISGNRGVAIQQVGRSTASYPSNDDNVFVRMCADLMKQILERDQRICCLEEQLKELNNQINANK